MKEQFRNPKRSKHQNGGYVLIFVVVTGLILITGALIISSQSLDGLVKSARRKNKDAAIEIAESGTSILLSELNSKFPYLLTIDCQVEKNGDTEQSNEPTCVGWNLEEVENICSGRSDTPNEIMPSLSGAVTDESGSYQLRNYEFLGDQIQGGTAIIQVEGQRFKDINTPSSLLATAVVEQEVTIAPKYCNSSPYDETGGGTSGYGLISGTVVLTDSDIVDQFAETNPSQANVNCTGCSAPNPDKSIAWDGVQNGTSVIDGKRSNDPEPKPLDFEIEPRDWGPTITPLNITLSSDELEINHTSHPNHCETDDDTLPLITHCRIGNVSISGGQFIVNPGDEGEIRLYLEGDLVAFSSDHFINMGRDFGQVALLGRRNPLYPTRCQPQQFAISGTDDFGPVFINMPCSSVVLNGNINIIGAAIVANWTANGNSNLKVPPDAAKIMSEKYNISFEGNEGREFAAIGNNRWNLIQLNDPQ